MQQNAAEAALTPTQERALEGLVAGETVTAAAELAGVDRTTVHRWKKDALFVAAFNERRAELRDATLVRLLSLAEKAARGLEQAVEAGDVRAILEVLKGLGLLDGTVPAIGSPDPEEVAEDAELAAKANAARRENAKLFAGVGW